MMNVRRMALVVAVLVLAVGGVVGYARLREQRMARSFQEWALEVLRERYPQHTFVADADPTIIAMPQERARLGLSNVRSLVEQASGTDADRRELLANFFALSLTNLAEARKGTAATWADMQTLVRPQLIGAGFRTEAGVTVVRRHVVGDLDEAFVIDRPKQIAYVTDARMKEWKVTPEDLHAKALENLGQAIAQESLDAAPAAGANARGRLVIIANHDGYASTRLLIPAFRQRLAAVLGDGYFVATPTRDELIAWSADYSERAALAAKVREDWQHQPYPISGTIWTVVGGDLRER